MPFRFRFETLLSYRNHLKDRAEIEFANANRHLKLARESLADVQERLSGARESLDRDLAAKMASHQLRNHVEYIDGLKSQARMLELEVARWEQVVRKRLQELLAKSKQHQVMEKLKGRDLQKWHRQQGLAEQKRLDELSVARHGRTFL
jgi:flagellar FliJ protein